jgi:hypothetical protein
MKLFNHIGIKAAAVMVAAGGLGFGLIGTGVHAAFTDGGVATENVSVGTFGITISSPGAVVTGGHGAWVVTYNAPQINSSAANLTGDPFPFTVTSTGTIPALIHVVKGAAPASPFTDLMASNPADVTLSGVGQSQTYNGGMAWGALSSANEGQTYSVSYTITTSA